MEQSPFMFFQFAVVFTVPFLLWFGTSATVDNLKNEIDELQYKLHREEERVEELEGLVEYHENRETVIRDALKD